MSAADRAAWAFALLCVGCGVDFTIGPPLDASADTTTSPADAAGEAAPGIDASDAGPDVRDAGPQPPCPDCVSPRACCYRGDAAATPFECSSGPLTCSVYECLSSDLCDAGTVCCFSGWTSASKPPSALCKSPKDCANARGVVLCATNDECAANDAGTTCATTDAAPTPFTVCQ